MEHPHVLAEHRIGLTVSTAELEMDCYVPEVQAPAVSSIEIWNSSLWMRKYGGWGMSASKETAWSYWTGIARELLFVCHDWEWI